MAAANRGGIPGPHIAAMRRCAGIDHLVIVVSRYPRYDHPSVTPVAGVTLSSSPRS